MINSESNLRAAVLTTLPQITYRRLNWLLAKNSADDVWLMLRGEQAQTAEIRALIDAIGIAEIWKSWCVESRVTQMRDQCEQYKIRVAVIGDDAFPFWLASDHQSPSVLFISGGHSSPLNPMVGVIGTRAATPAGRHFAHQLGFELSQHGVSVVSGLAKGIDAAAHAGVRAAQTSGTTIAPPIAVVANGLDTVYPKQHRALFEFVVSQGAVISESPPGTSPEPFRFPLRNRIIAALSKVLVVVESRNTGGSMHTVEAAIARSIPVLAVPGAVGSHASEGTNRLISEGAVLCTQSDDVLVALGLSSGARRVPASRSFNSVESKVLEAVATGPQSLDALQLRTQLDLLTLVRALDQLESTGVLLHEAGWWQAANKAVAI